MGPEAPPAPPPPANRYADKALFWGVISFLHQAPYWPLCLLGMLLVDSTGGFKGSPCLLLVMAADGCSCLMLPLTAFLGLLATGYGVDGVNTAEILPGQPGKATAVLGWILGELALNLFAVNFVTLLAVGH